MNWWHEAEDRRRSSMWPPPYEPSEPLGERVAKLEQSQQHQGIANRQIWKRLDTLEQAQRRAEQLARLKAARKAARRDVVRTVQWAASIIASVAYVGHLIVSGQWVALLRFVLGLDSS